MKKIYFILFSLLQIILLGNVELNAQCTVNISGNNCVGSTLTANFSGGSLQKLEWVKVAKNGKGKIVGWADTLNFIITVAGGHGSDFEPNQLKEPRGIYVDSDENIYVADGGNNRIQKWAADATSGVTVAGGNGKGAAPNQFHEPRGIDLDAEGNIYIADGQNNRKNGHPAQ